MFYVYLMCVVILFTSLSKVIKYMFKTNGAFLK